MGFRITANALVVTVPDEQSLEDALNTMTVPAVFTIKSKGFGYTAVSLNGPFLSPEATDVIAKMTGLVNAEQLAINDFVNSQSLNGTGGNWGTSALNYADSKIDNFTHMGMQTSGNSLTSWRNTFTGTPVAAPTHVPGTGFTFIRASSQYIDTNYDPTSNAIKYLAADALFGCKIVTITNPATVRQVIMGTDTPNTRIDSRGDSTVHDFIINAGTGLNVAVPGLQNGTLYVAAMTSAGTTGFAKGLSEGNTPLVGSAISSLDFYVGAKHNFDLAAIDFVDGTLSSYVIGAGIGFDQVSFDADLAILDTALAAV